MFVSALTEGHTVQVRLTADKSSQPKDNKYSVVH